MKRLVFGFVCLLSAVPAMAATLVTWQADGAIYGSRPLSGLYTAAPVGTPLSVTVSFDPSAATQTFGNVAGCMTVPVSASVSIGAATYSATGAGFTHAQLPGTNCLSSGTGGFTQFSLHNLQQPANSPWSPLSGGVHIFDYRDLLVQSLFPSTPTALNGHASLFYAAIDSPTWSFEGSLTFRDVTQPTPVPEPATLSLLAMGVAAAVRARGRGASS